MLFVVCNDDIAATVADIACKTRPLLTDFKGLLICMCLYFAEIYIANVVFIRLP